MKLTRTIRGREYAWEIVPRLDSDTQGLQGYDLIPAAGTGVSLFLESPEGKEISYYALDQALANYVNSNLARFIDASVTWLSPVYAVVELSKLAAEDYIYTDHFPTEQTDYNYGEDRHDTRDFYNLDGTSTGKKKPGGSTTVTKEEMMERGESESTGYTNGMQPSSEPTGGTWDAPGSSAPEGESWGLQPSYSAADFAINFYAKVAARSDNWSLSGDAQFNKFIDTAAESLQGYKRCGMSRDNALDSVKKTYAHVFSGKPWLGSILDRFADQVYGTAKKAKCESATVGSGIADYVEQLHASGTPRAKAAAKLEEEYSSWLENSPDTRIYAQACLDRKYGIRIAADARLSPGKKLKLVAYPTSEGIILSFEKETPEAITLRLAWVTPEYPEQSAYACDISEVVVTGDASAAEAAQANDPAAKTAALSVLKSADTFYINLLMAQSAALPMGYSDFRTWCNNQGLPADLTHRIERAALELNFVSIPDGLEVTAEKELYVSDDKTQVQTLEVSDPSKKPEKLVQDGKELKRAIPQ